MSELEANFQLNTNSIEAGFTLSPAQSMDALFELHTTGAMWGLIGGTLSNQTDLQNALTGLQTNINSEATTRAENDTLLQNNINTVAGNLTAEETARASADTIITNNLNTHKNNKNNPHEVTKEQIGVTKTSDLTNDGDGTSQYATKNYVNLYGGKIDKIKVNGNEQTITNKTVDISVPLVINNVTTTSTTNALSANMGKELQDEINNIKARGRYLSTWNCTTGLAGTTPTTLPYTYKTGDYFIVSTVGTTNLKPNGTEYTGQASETVESGTVKVNDTYIYDGSTWTLLHGEEVEVTFASIGGQPTDNTNLATALNSKVTGNSAISGATKTKITYDSKGLVTSGADLEASDIPDLTLSKITDVTATATELNYVDGVTSNIQTQLDGKANDNSVLHTTAGAETVVSNSTDGYKTFNNSIKIGNPSNQAYSTLTTDSNGILKILANAKTSGITFNSMVVEPNIDNTISLGSSTKAWNNLYLDGKINNNGNEISLPSTAGTLALSSEIQSYTAGNGIDIDDNEISVKTSTGISINNGVSVDDNVFRNVATGTESWIEHKCSNSQVLTKEGVTLVGNGAVSDDYGTVFGDLAGAGRSGVAVGFDAQSSNDASISIGQASVASGECSVALGGGNGSDEGAKVQSAQGIAIGNKAKVSTSQAGSIAIGAGSKSAGTNAVAIGGTTNFNSGYQTTAAGSCVAIGYRANANYFNSIAIGGGDGGGTTSSNASYSLALGYRCTTNNSAGYSTAIGMYSNTTGQYSIAIGSSSTYNNRTTATQYGIGIGYECNATGNSSIAIGKNAKATAQDAVQLGAGTNATANTLNFRNYQLVDASGYIPIYRLGTELEQGAEYILTGSDQADEGIWKTYDEVISKASSSTYGIVKVDGTTITSNNGVLSASATQPTYNSTTETIEF